MALERAVLRVPGLHCDGCVRTVTAAVGGVGGVEEVEGDLARLEVRVAYDPERTGLEGIAALLESIGYPAQW